MTWLGGLIFFATYIALNLVVQGWRTRRLVRRVASGRSTTFPVRTRLLVDRDPDAPWQGGPLTVGDDGTTSWRWSGFDTAPVVVGQAGHPPRPGRVLQRRERGGDRSARILEFTDATGPHEVAMSEPLAASVLTRLTELSRRDG